MNKTILVVISIIALIVGLVIFMPQGNTEGDSEKKFKVGFSVDDLRVERWTKDRDYFLRKATELGAEVIVQSAEGKESTQIQQIENLITEKVQTLVIVPFNGDTLSNVIADAKKEGIYIVDYDRLIKNSDVDVYVTFDSYKVGQMQAKALIDVNPKGNYYLIEGSVLDNNTHLLLQGQMDILQPLIDKGDVKLLGRQWAKDWLPEEALKIAENALTVNNNKIDAFVAGNDGLAAGIIQALKAQGLEGKVLVSGQDAALEGIKNVKDGFQTATVYKSVKNIAETCAEVSIDLIKGKKYDDLPTINNDFKEVPTIYLDIVKITKDNIDHVIDEGFHKKEDVYGSK